MTRDEKILEALWDASESDDEVFQKIISALIDSKMMTEQDLSRTFSVPRPTVRRWKEGKTAPHPLMRKAMTTLLRNYLFPKK